MAQKAARIEPVGVRAVFTVHHIRAPDQIGARRNCVIAQLHLSSRQPIEDRHRGIKPQGLFPHRLGDGRRLERHRPLGPRLDLVIKPLLHVAMPGEQAE